MITDKDDALQYVEARKAVRGASDASAFLRLGNIYVQGIGTTPNHALANYFFDKAALLGCEEAYDYISREYETGARNLYNDLEKDMPPSPFATPAKLKRYRMIVDSIRVKKYYGLLSRVRQYLPLLFPDYSKEQAISDILNGRDTADADIFFSQSTYDNKSEMDIESQDLLLEQLYAPITQDADLSSRIKEENNTNVLGHDARELMLALANYTESYNAICKKHHISKKEIMTPATMDLYPYIKVSTMVTLRKQMVRCLLSIKDTDKKIKDEYLNCLDRDEELLNVCERIKDEDIQLFLISYVELNIDLDSLTITTLSLLRDFRSNNLTPLAKHLNAFADRLEERDIKHNLPRFTKENLPRIELK